MRASLEQDSNISMTIPLIFMCILCIVASLTVNNLAKVESVIQDNTEYLTEHTYLEDGKVVYANDPKYSAKISGDVVHYTYDATIDSVFRIIIGKTQETLVTPIKIRPKYELQEKLENK